MRKLHLDEQLGGQKLDVVLSRGDTRAIPGLGHRLRDARKKRRLTLQKVADATSLSKSFVSQIENDQAKPSIATLKRIASFLEIQLADLFEDLEQGAAPRPGEPAGSEAAPLARVVRSDQRKALQWPGSTSKSQLLTPDLKRKLEVILTEAQPGDELEYEPYLHEGEEFGHVLSGRYEVTVGDEVYELNAGDSIYFESRHPHRMRVIGSKPAVTLWVITPPSF
jgi:transcriptional regulator with XRE-family HTH domain